MFEEEQFSDEHVGWPSYVYFLSSFAFVLIVFVGSLLYLLSGDIHQRWMDQKIRPIQGELEKAGIVVRREGNKLILPLKGEHFDRWLALFEQTAREIFPADAADLFMDRARRIADSFEMGIATTRGEIAKQRHSR